MGKYGIALWAMAAMTAAATPALAQDAPAAAGKKAPAASSVGGMTKGGGAVSSSYARCTPEPGSPIGGIVVKGGKTDSSVKAGEAEGNCPPTGAGEPAEGKGRTYTGGRRNADAPSAAVEANAAAPAANAMPSRLSMTPTTAKAVAPAQPADKSISEKGVSSSKPR